MMMDTSTLAAYAQYILAESFIPELPGAFPAGADRRHPRQHRYRVYRMAGQSPL
jgi:hypothetical protein